MTPGDRVTVHWPAFKGHDEGEYLGSCSESPNYVRVRIELEHVKSDYIVKKSQVKAVPR